MRVKVNVHRGRLGAEEFRVIRPAEPMRRATVLDGDSWVHLYADADWAWQLGVLWLLAARSRRSLVHLSPHGVLPDDHEDAGLPRLDLVLLHHSLQFKPSRWKALRGRLDRGRPHTADVPDTDIPAPGTELPARHYRDRDLFDEHLHAETLFLVGSATLFRATADRFLDVAEYGPRPDSTRSGGHYCAELHPNEEVRHTARRYHIVHTEDWR